MFDSTGQFLYSFGCNGEDEGQFNAPTGIAIDPYDNILVADWGNSRVQVLLILLKVVIKVIIFFNELKIKILIYFENIRVGV